MMANMNVEFNQIILRSSVEKDEESVAELLHDNFPDAPDKEVIQKTWRWQFKNSFSKNTGVAVAELEDKIVAHYAVMWLPMVYRGKKIDGAISTATVTDKRVRGKGLFTTLANRVYQEIKGEGCKIVFGFPNSQSIRGFLDKLEWFEIGIFPLHLKIFNFCPFMARVLGKHPIVEFLGKVINRIASLFYKILYFQRGSKNIRVVEIKSIEDEMGKIWERSFLMNKIALVRDKKYLEWRYVRKPYFKYNIHAAYSKENKIVGYVITSVSEKFGIRFLYIMELLALEDSKEIYKELLSFTDKIATKARADAVSMLLFPHHPRYLLFLRYGFLPVAKRFFPQDIYFGARIISDDIEKDYIRNCKNWYISWGDLDVV